MFHVIIPARFAAARLPGKPLLDIHGKPLIQWVWERSLASGADSVLIATDDERILAAAERFGAEAVMTSAQHASGTDRIAEVVRLRGLARDEIVVNVQGDEPMLPAGLIRAIAAALAATAAADIATAVAPIQSQAELLDPNTVKAVRGLDGRALYFSRAPIPWPRDAVIDGRPQQFAGALRHIGIYGFRVESLLRFAALPASALEQAEKLEQLRALEHGMRIQIVASNETPPLGVDTPEDLERVRALLRG